MSDGEKKKGADKHKATQKEQKKRPGLTTAWYHSTYDLPG